MNTQKHPKKLLTLMIALAICVSMIACGGRSTKKAPPPPETGSFINTYTVLDAQGRKTGTLSIDPRGTAELRDTEGNLIGSFTSKAEPAGQPAPVMKEGSSAAEKSETMSEEKGEAK